jgi:transposase InsO family protein
MAWMERSVVDERREFVRLARMEGANRRELCRRFGIHPSTGYKWLGRGEDLEDRSRRPHTSPSKIAPAVEARILTVRDEHPAWGARKIQRRLKGTEPPPPRAASTVHASLVRNERIRPQPGGKAAKLRFEKPAPNLLWQMDHKGWIRLGDGMKCHPLTIVDDHSRYAIGLDACADQQGTTVRACLEEVFRHYGLPEAFFVDNGPPWGDSSGARWTKLGVWLLKLGIAVLHSRPYHPQSRGKNERFHRTLRHEVLELERFGSLGQAQRAFDRWRPIYNHERPHEALGLDVPASRYRPSERSFPEHLPEVEYDEGEIVRTVPATKDYISYKGQLFKVPQAFRRERLAIRPRGPDGDFGIFFGAHLIATGSLKELGLTKGMRAIPSNPPSLAASCEASDGGSEGMASSPSFDNNECVGDVSEHPSAMSSD